MQRLGRCVQPPRAAGNTRRRKKQEGPSPAGLVGAWPCRHRELGLPAPRTETISFCCCKPPICSALLQRVWQMDTCCGTSLPAEDSETKGGQTCHRLHTEEQQALPGSPRTSLSPLSACLSHGFPATLPCLPCRPALAWTAHLLPGSPLAVHQSTQYLLSEAHRARFGTGAGVPPVTRAHLELRALGQTPLGASG